MKTIASIVVVLLIFTACTRRADDLRQVSLPQITTAEAVAYKTTAFSGGTINSGDSITERGVCWDTLPNPTRAGSHTLDGVDTGTFNSILTGLRPATTYYVRAFATNSAGTAYGNEVTLKTLDRDLYFAGCTDPAGHPVATYWANGIPTYLTAPTTQGYVNRLFVSGTDVYAGGIELNGNYNWVAKTWKNGVLLRTLSDGSSNASVDDILVVGNDVYAAGFDHDTACLWKNGVRSILPGGEFAVSLAVSGTDVYACGYYYGGYNNPESYAMFWKNGVKTELTNRSTLSNAFCMTTSGSDIYIGGREGATAKIWKNGVAQSLPGSGFHSFVQALCINGSDLHAGGGDFRSPNSNPFPAYWKNGIIQPLGQTNIGEVSSIFAFGQEVYVCGFDGPDVFVYRNGNRFSYSPEANTVKSIYLH